MIEETVLPNGLRVITKQTPGAAATVGAFVNIGSRHETTQNAGVAHFLEHMAFQGTTGRSSHEIARQIEILGASTNARTTLCDTIYHVSGLAEHIPVGIEILGDVLTDSKYDPEAIRLQSQVILQEISQAADHPFHRMAELLTATAFPDQAIGRPTLGTRDFVAGAAPDDFRALVASNYSAETMLLIAAGGMEHATVVEVAARAFAKVPAATNRAPTVPAIYAGGVGIDRDTKFTQVNIGICFESVPIREAAMYPHAMLASALGAGLSSPLFREVREKRGLAYQVGAQSSFESDFGIVSMIAMLTPENVDEYIKVACAEFARCCDAIEEDDLMRARNSALVGIALAQESAGKMAFYMAHSLFRHGHIRDFDEVRRNIEAVTVDDLKAAARDLRRSRPTIALVGPVPEADYEGMVAAALGRPA
jgi:predicted Zn-dependent peptidase